MMENDTIAAIATPVGNSGLGVIRISGAEAVKTADRIIRSRSGSGLDLCKKPTHTASYGFVYDGDECIDEVMVLIFLSPKSYTRENVVEISCHGGMYVLGKVLSVVLKNGARLAQPGEFTKRAFLNGRIDLTEAEAVMDIISSENEFSRKNSISQLKGSVKDLILDLREKLLSECALIEAALDDPEHYDLSDHMDILHRKIVEMINDADKLISSSKDVRFLKEGIRVAITGRTNAGKSSLLNMLTGYDRAIVTDEEGTTRDVIEEKISLDGLTLYLFDTAGIRRSDNEAENLGIEKAYQYLERADLILFMIDSSRELDENDLGIFEIIKEKQAIVLLNKSDLKAVTDINTVKRHTDRKILCISVKENDGINELKDSIRELFNEGKISDNNMIYLTNERQLDAFTRARDSLLLVKEGIEKGYTEDVLTVDIMDAYGHLGSVIGQSTEDDLADRIFEDFCMGK